MRFTDSHCHLDFDPLNLELTKLLLACSESGVKRIVVPGVSPDNWQQVLALKSTNQVTIYKALGIHPWYLNDLDESALACLENSIDNNQDKLVAVGEIGIDGKIAEQQHNLTKQIQFFDRQLAIASKRKLPAIIHHRKSHPIIVERLKSLRFEQGGIIHAFSGSYQQAKHYLDKGFKLGIGGTITYDRAEKTRKTVSKLPIDSIVLETDAPSMPVFSQKEPHNSPLNIPLIFNCLTKLRTETAEQLAFQLENNITSAFNLQKL